MKEDKAQKQKIEDLEKKIEELENSWKRALADYKNLEKRVEEDKKSWGLFANENLLLNLLPVLDNLEKVLEHSKDEGIKITLKEFLSILKASGLEEIDPKGEIFDPMKMEAIEVIEGKKDEIVETVSKGYFLNKKLIRPAKVKVGNGKKEK